MSKCRRRGTRIKAEHKTLQQMVEALAGSNIGGLTALLAITRKAEEIGLALGPFGPLLELDTMGIWDENIFILHAYVATGMDREKKVDPFKTICLLAAVQQDIITEKTLKEAIEGYKSGRMQVLDLPMIIEEILAKNKALRDYHEAHSTIIG